jgi:hypothetical protein
VFGPEVKAQKSDYMVMFRSQSAGQNNSIQIGNKSFESGGLFKYLETALKKNKILFMKKLRAA